MMARFKGPAYSPDRDRYIPVTSWRISHATLLALSHQQSRATSQHKVHAEGTVIIRMSAVPETFLLI